MPIENALKTVKAPAPCRRCHKNPTNLIYGVCEDCLINSIGHARFKERPKCRERINQLLQDVPGLTLCKLAFWVEYDTVPIIPSDTIRTQARKMLQENRSKHP